MATSVIEVGVDVERLGLLTIIRQPKTTAQYIQVSGRVGRSPRQGPGLVVTVLNPLSGRDISHYERFSSVHERLYAAVEPASVTPFTDAALTRGLRGTVAAVVRQLRRGGGGAVDPDDEQLVGDAAEQVAVRAGQVGDDRTAGRVRAVAAGLLAEFRAAWPRRCSGGQQPARRAVPAPAGRSRTRRPGELGGADVAAQRRRRRCPAHRRRLAACTDTAPTGGRDTRSPGRDRGVMVSRTFHTPLRRAHAIAPFGPGSLLLTRNRVSAVVCGLPVLAAVAAGSTSRVGLDARRAHHHRPAPAGRLRGKPLRDAVGGG